MAVEVFKEGQSFLIEPDALQRHLQAGYTLTDASQPEAKIPGIEILNLKAQGAKAPRGRPKKVK